MNPGGMMASHESTKARRSTPVEKRLKFIAPLRNERTIATSEHVDYLGLENIQSWTGKLLPSATSDTSEGEGSASGTANFFYSGDVLFGKLRPYLAKAFHADKDGVCSTELLVLKPRPDIYPRFLFYSMLSLDFVSRVDASTFGAKMPRANWEFIGSMKLPTPNYETQRLIADYLDRETARIDALVAEKEKMLALLEEKRAALISRAVTRGLDPNVPLKPSGLDWLGDIPAHWETRRIKHGFSTIGSGTTPPTNHDDYYDGNIPWVTTSELRENKVTSTDKHVSARALRDFSSLKIYPENSLLFAMYGATIGRVAMLGVPATVNQAVCVLAGEESFLCEFVFYVLQATREVLTSYATGGGQPNLNAEKLYEFSIPCPPLSEQKQIRTYLDKELQRFEVLSAEIDQSIELLKERRAALITAAVTGQIPVEEMSL